MTLAWGAGRSDAWARHRRPQDVEAIEAAFLASQSLSARALHGATLSARELRDETAAYLSTGGEPGPLLQREIDRTRTELTYEQGPDIADRLSAYDITYAIAAALSKTQAN